MRTTRLPCSIWRQHDLLLDLRWTVEPPLLALVRRLLRNHAHWTWGRPQDGWPDACDACAAAWEARRLLARYEGARAEVTW